MAKLNIDLEIESELFQWFEEYCEDGLLDLDEELCAVIENFIQDQLDEEGAALETEQVFEDPDSIEDAEDDFEEDFYAEDESE